MERKTSRREFLRKSAFLAAGTALALDGKAGAGAQEDRRRVIVWSEGTAPKEVYPADINSAIADGLRQMRRWDVLTASLDDPDQGLSDSLLKSATVLIWWGHVKHGDVKDALVQRIARRVREEGMGFIATHSAHWSKPFKALLKATGDWKGGYVEDGSKLNLTVADKKHPIARDIKDFVVPKTERYTEPFDIPTPASVVFDGLYTLPNGKTEKSRQGITWTVGKGRVFYFQPGHETYPIYFQPEIQQVFRQAVRWAASRA